MNRIEDLIIKTIISAENNLLNAYTNLIQTTKNPCFEIFGFDILLDSNLNAWLIEVNLSPSLNCDSPLDLKIKGELIAEIFDVISIKNIINIVGIIPLYLRDKESEYIIQNSNLILEKKLIDESSHIEFMKDFKFTKEIREILWDTDEEFKRLKKFRRIFPNASSLKYRKLFFRETPLNLILSLREAEITSSKENLKKLKKLNLINMKSKLK